MFSDRIFTLRPCLYHVTSSLRPGSNCQTFTLEAAHKPVKHRRDVSLSVMQLKLLRSALCSCQQSNNHTIIGGGSTGPGEGGGQGVRELLTLWHIWQVFLLLNISIVRVTMVP